MRTKITKMGANFIGALLLSGLALSANAQLSLTGSSYTQNFNDLANGMPTGWTVRTGANATALGTDASSAAILTPSATTAWGSTSGGFKNFASADAYPFYGGVTATIQQADSNRALGVRQVSATNTDVAFVLEIANTANLASFNLSFSLQGLDSTSPRVATWIVDYAMGANPTTFMPATTVGTMTTGGNTYTNNMVTVNFGTALDNQAGPVYIRVATVSATTGSGARPSTAIDNVHLTWSGAATATNILATDYMPMGSMVPLTTSSLMVKYDNPIAKGTGNISLYKVGSASPVVFDVTSADVTVSDSTATISLASSPLANASEYFVNIDAGAFTKTGGTLPCLALMDSATWSFSTEDTVPPTPMTSLNETFTGCVNTAMSYFHQYSVADAAKYWRCSVYGNGDSAAVYINGGSATGVSVAQNDWLITNAPLDFSAMTVPELSFYQKRRFGGDVVRDIKVSTDYVVGTDPTTATWMSVNAAAMTNAPDSNVWSHITGIDLSAYKATPFYLAFTYECGSTGAYELTYDDIMVSEQPNSIKDVKGATVGVHVLGEATTNTINLNIDAKTAAQYEVQLFDLLGRKVSSKNVYVNAGANRVSMNNLNLTSGMYIIRVIGNNGFGTVKTVVK